jgi:hypothetical protein
MPSTMSQFGAVVIAVILTTIQCSCSRPYLAAADRTADNLRLTSANAPLPQEACRAQLTFAYDAPESLSPGEQASVHLLIKNVSNAGWPYTGQLDGKYQIHVGNRWLDQQANALDDARADLPYDLGPGEQAEVLIIVTAPTTEGEYNLEFDVLQEHVTWFSKVGSKTLSTKVVIE